FFKIERGEGNGKVASNLEKEKIIAGQWYFYYYLRSHGMLNKILPGEYELSGNMTIPEIAEIITTKKEKFVKITFPEGWDSKKMAARLNENGLDGEGFLELVNNPGDLKKRYDYLNSDEVKTLEGFLFPDTYFFKPQTEAKNIVGRMLDTFDEKINSAGLRGVLTGKNIKVKDAVTMASILEGEVKSEKDRKIVSGIFWSRIKNGMPLQSCATLAYALGKNKDQYSIEDTQVKSPYNTYQIKGLPPAPINNPGIMAISAAADPEESDYNFFLTDPKTGETIFSKTAEEHNQNKARVGL
ncbi:MAG TPA: endolytic transglycosylase MltG, partial [Patescibacteria group bacterium]|nr:endolytic transglycosylase MltG [Patescibacteria group bacterium]